MHLPSLALLTALSLSAASASAQNVVRVPPANPAPAAEPTAPEDPSVEEKGEGVSSSDAGAPSSAAPVDAGAPVEGEAPAADAPRAEGAPANEAELRGSSAGTRELASSTPERSAPEEEEIDPETLPLTGHQLHFGVSVGVRASWISSDSIDPFASKNGLVGPDVRLSWAPLAAGRFSFALSPEWSFAQSGSTARGLPTSISAHRLSLGLEGRYHLLNALHLYLRVAPGAVNTRASLGEGANRLSSDDWAFHVDGVVGAAVRIIGSSDGRERTTRMHLYVEGGYDWTSAFDLRLRGGEESPPRSEPLALGSFEWSAPHVGGGVAVTF